jgi:PAS domain S-box-containing protein
MADSTIDYRAVFRTLPGALALLTPEGVILDVNEGFLDAAGRELGQVLGRSLFDAFPENPADPGDHGPAQLRGSFARVVASGERDVMSPIRYDVEDPGRPGEFEERYWAIINTPLRSESGEVTLIASKSDEVTHIVNESRNRLADHG